jgi:hypothetical protein
MLPPNPRFLCCVKCKEEFSAKNVFTPLGWKETQLSGFCEACFDRLFADDDEPPAGADEEIE